MGMGRVLLVVAMILCSSACQRSTPEEASTAPLALPHFIADQQAVDRLQLVGAGERTLWTLEKRNGSWVVADRDGWPAATDQVAHLMFALAQLRLADSKTDDTSRYPRIGVEDVTADTAGGVELRIGAGGAGHRLIVGHDGSAGGSFVRIDGNARSWLTDKRLELPRDPLQWLDRSLLDRPLARIESVEIKQQHGATFRLEHRGDRFVMVGVRDTNAEAEALAGGLDQLKLEDVVPDVPAAKAEREVRFLGVDGINVTLALWREQGQVWARVMPSLDDARASVWAAQSPKDPARQLARVREQIEAWKSKFDGRRFRLVPLQAVNLMLGRSQLIGGKS